MGSAAYGLGQLGTEIAGAKDLQRQQRIQDIQLALERQKLLNSQAELGVSQRYAATNEQRARMEQADFEERQRIAKLPKFVGFRTVGGKLYYGLQNPDGTVQTKEVTGVDSAQDAQALEQSIQALPADAQNAARAAIVPYLQAEDYPGARGALKPILQKYAETQFPGQETISSTTQNVVLDVPGKGPTIVAVPRTTTTRKVPVGSGTAKTPSYAKPGDANISQSSKDLGLPPGAKVLGSKPPSRAEVSKLVDPVGDADRRYAVMLDAVKNVNAQNDVALLFNHIGMTLSAQRGARITNAEIQRAISARSLPEDLQALWDSRAEGPFLTVDQRKNMLELGKKNRELIWQQAWEKSKAETLADKMPRTLPGLPPVAGVHYMNEDVPLKAGGKARITKINPDGSYEAKPY